MHLTFLGTGTSHGIPVIGCKCNVCRSKNKKNKRSRSSVWIRGTACSILIDTSLDFRNQALENNITDVDSILYTHSHADHLHGLDDVRIFCRGKSIATYGDSKTLSDIKKRYSYIFRKTQKGGGKPSLELKTIGKNGVKIGEISVIPIPIQHGRLKILGYRLNNIAYLTDCSHIPEKSITLLQKLDVLIIGALRYKKHKTHFSISEAVEAIERLSPKRAYLTHLCHDIDHDVLLKKLPEKIEPAYDGLEIEI